MDVDFHWRFGQHLLEDGFIEGFDQSPVEIDGGIVEITWGRFKRLVNFFIVKFLMNLDIGAGC